MLPIDSQVAEGASCVQLVTFPYGSEKADDDAAVYTGEMETKPLQAFVTESLPNFVVMLESAEAVQGFLQVSRGTTSAHNNVLVENAILAFSCLLRVCLHSSLPVYSFCLVSALLITSVQSACQTVTWCIWNDLN